MAALTDARRIVVKIGSALLVDRATGALRADWLASLAGDVAELRARGADVILVSSGSIALGRGVLGLPATALSLEQSQAAAAVGQIKLAGAYEAALARHGLQAAQVLVTLEDSEDRRRYLNSRATLEQLLRLGTVPIVNENDTVATDEIRYGDNDRLAAQVAVTAGADVLILLSDVDGLYTANPQTEPGARHLAHVAEITPEIEAMAGDAGSGLSKGGMKTKIMAARTATAGGCAMAITRGDRVHPGGRAHRGRARHLVRGTGRPAAEAQGLDRGDEAARPRHRRCGCRARARLRQQPAFGGGERGLGQLRTGRPGGGGRRDGPRAGAGPHAL